MRISQVAALAAAIGISASTAPVAHAAFALILDDPDTAGRDVVVVDEAPIGTPTRIGFSTHADLGVGSGLVSFNGGFGSWSVNVTSGLSAPQIGPGRLDLVSVNVSGAAGVLGITLTDTDYSGPVPAYITEYGGVTDGSIKFEFGYDSLNREFGATVLLDSSGPLGPGSFSGGTTGTLTPIFGSYSLIATALIEHQNALDVTSFNAVVTTVPVPAAVWLFGSGLIGLIGIARRKKS